MKLVQKHILLFFLFTLFGGTLFFIPPVFVNRFTTAPALWLQAGIAIGMPCFIFMKSLRVFLPPPKFLFLVVIVALYYLWRAKWHPEAIVSVALYYSTFFLFYQFFKDEKDGNKLFHVFTVIAAMLCIWCAGQFARWLPSFHNSLSMTGPFDNPAGISASLSLLLPFAIYETCKSNKWRQIMGVIISLVTVVFVILSGARAAILAVAVIVIAYTIRWIKTGTEIEFLTIYYYLVVAMVGILFVGLYFIKKDSANGRILILKCTGQLIAKKPVFGYGKNGFTANYMNEQALYFTEHPNSKYSMLADNVRHPFNEYFKNIVEYGGVGFLLFVTIPLYPLYCSRKNNSKKLLTVRLSLLAIGICAMFSYPLNYPFVRLMTVALLTFLLAYSHERRMTITNNHLVKGVVLVISFGLLSFTAFQAMSEREWHTIAHKSIRGETVKMLPRYSSLYTYMRHNDLFLYNYAAELNVAGLYDESYKIARECNNLWADYDLQMLMADNTLHLQQYDKTESYLNKAAAMCPVKFMPLYRLAELYMETGQTDEARSLAQKIVEKDVKIPSPVIGSIKMKMRNFVKESEQ